MKQADVFHSIIVVSLTSAATMTEQKRKELQSMNKNKIRKALQSLPLGRFRG